jgi:hypothetical protein
MAVRIEKNGSVWTVIHDQPEARNAMDPMSADAREKLVSRLLWTVPHRCKYGREGRGGSGALQGGSTGAGGTAAWRGSGGLCGSKTSVELPVHSQPMTPQNGEIATTGASPRSTSTSFASGPPLTV